MAWLMFVSCPQASCRICCRCGTEYMVSASGSCIRREECVHHWGRLRKQRGTALPGGLARAGSAPAPNTESAQV